MSAHHTFPQLDQRRQPSWHDLHSIAVKHPAFAAAALYELREQATAYIGCDRATAKAIADACQAWFDCTGEPEDQQQALDEIDALLTAGDEPREPDPWSYADYCRDVREMAGGRS